MRAYERLLKYAKVYTTSDPESGTHPSAAREFDLAHLLVEEMKSIGIEDAFVDEHCYVYGSIPATKGCEKKPALGLIAHMDTAPDASGENVKPILHENYDGGDVTLPGTGMVMKTSLLVDGAERTFTSFVVAMLSGFGVMASSCTSAGHLAVSRSGVPPRWLEAKMDATVQLLLVTSMATCPL